MITKTVRLPLPVDAAFALFTDRADRWWPRERRHTDDPASVIVLDRGGLRETAAGGVAILGTTVTWEPPALLVLDFYPGTDAEHPTRVTVTFVGDGAETVVTVHHAPTEASAALWDARAPRYGASWDLLLPALHAAAVR